MSVPVFLSLMNESPRWLITKQRYNRVYKILFGQPCHYDIQPTIATATEISTDKKTVCAKIFPIHSLYKLVVKQRILF